MRAVTWTESGLPRGAFPPSNIDNRLATDADRSREGALFSSGDVSLDRGGEGVKPPLVRELARSATDGERAGSRTLPLRTEKKAEDGLSLGTPSVGAPLLTDSISSALIRCEMLDPILPVLGAR